MPDDDPAALHPGGRFAGYEILGLLGEGGQGAVYRARRDGEQREVAFKVIRPDLAGDPTQRARFLAELDALTALEHQYIIPVHARGETAGTVWVAMRLCALDLGSLIRRDGRLSLRRTVAILEQVAKALDFVHERGIVHRDIKPANIMLDAQDGAYLSDFGIMKRLADAEGRTMPGVTLGTLEYMAPEQFAPARFGGGDPALAPAIDIYALGCVAYACLTGAPPFTASAGGEREQVMFGHTGSEPEAPSLREPSLPAGVDAAVLRALAKQPGDRYPTAGAFIGDLRTALQLHGGETLILGAAGPGSTAPSTATGEAAATPPPTTPTTPTPPATAEPQTQPTPPATAQPPADQPLRWPATPNPPGAGTSAGPSGAGAAAGGSTTGTTAGPTLRSRLEPVLAGRMPLVIGGAIVLLLVIVVGLNAAAGRPTPTPTPSTATSPTPTPSSVAPSTPPPTATSTATAPAGPSPVAILDVDELLLELDGRAGATGCAEAAFSDTDPLLATARVVCDAGAGWDAAVFFLFDTDADAEAWVTSRVADGYGAAVAECENARTWRFGSDTAASPVRGLIQCSYLEFEGGARRPQVVWTERGNGVAGFINGPVGGTVTNLWAAWKTSALAGSGLP